MAFGFEFEFRVEGLGFRVCEFDVPRSCTDRYSSQFENNCLTKMCSGSEAGAHLRRIDSVYHSTLGLKVMKKKKKKKKDHPHVPTVLPAVGAMVYRGTSLMIQGHNTGVPRS